MSYKNGSVMVNFRRRQGPAQSVRSTGSAGTGGGSAASGETAGGKDEGGRMKDEGLRAVMVAHTVRILADYDGLNGRYGTVVGESLTGSAVLVRLAGSDRKICFTSCEVTPVPMNDPLLDQRGDFYSLVARAVRLALWPKWDGAEASPTLKAAVQRRADRLKRLVDAFKRERQTLVRAQWAAENGLSNTTTAIVLWTGGAR